MAELPEDPHGEGYVVEDECAAVGMAVLDVFCAGADFVIVRKTEGTINIFGFGVDDDPTTSIDTIASADGSERYYEVEDGYFDEDEEDWDD